MKWKVWELRYDWWRETFLRLAGSRQLTILSGIDYWLPLAQGKRNAAGLRESARALIIKPSSFLYPHACCNRPEAGKNRLREQEFHLLYLVQKNKWNSWVSSLFPYPILVLLSNLCPERDKGRGETNGILWEGN